jgi:hypothetical protein
MPKENEPKEKAPLVLACGLTALLALSGVQPNSLRSQICLEQIWTPEAPEG